MKIALISSSCFPVSPDIMYGGLERVVWDLAVALSELGHEITVVGTKNSKAPPNGHVIETVEFTGNLNAFGFEPKAYEVYKDRLKDFDIIHDHSWLSFPYLAKIENSILKVCKTFHGHCNWSRPAPVKYMNLIAISNYLALETSKRLGIPVRSCYNGIDTDLYKFQREKGDRLLYVGRFAKYKCPHIAIEVARRLRIPLDLVGGETFIEDHAYVQSLRNECDGLQIRWFGEVPHSEKIRLMQRAKCLLFPSQMGEPFGLVAAEAGACGCPTIALDDGAIKEVVEHGKTGFVCRSVDEMCEAVKKIDEIKPEDCRCRVEKYFSRKKMAENYLNLYHLILSGEEW